MVPALSHIILQQKVPADDFDFSKSVSTFVYVEKYIFANGQELTHSHTMTPFDAPGKEEFWKHCGKRRNCS